MRAVTRRIFSDRIETHGDGAVRTISYFNPDTINRWFDSHNVFHTGYGQGQNLMDHVTDFTNNLSVTERHEYDWTRMFQTPTKITDMRGNVTQQTWKLFLVTSPKKPIPTLIINPGPIPTRPTPIMSPPLQTNLGMLLLFCGKQLINRQA